MSIAWDGHAFNLAARCLVLVTAPSPRLPEIAAEAIAGGVNVVQVRLKPPWQESSWSDASAVVCAASRKAAVIINGPVSLVRQAGADGLHLPENDPLKMTVAEARQLIAPAAIVGRSVHSIGAARAAESEGVDYVIAGTIFPSASHPGQAPAGIDFLKAVCRAVSVPVIAIGGVTIDNLAQCIEAGAAGVAVLSPIMHAADSKEAAATYRAVLDIAWRRSECN